MCIHIYIRMYIVFIEMYILAILCFFHMCCLAATCFLVVFVSLIPTEDLEAVIAQGWALAKCQGHSMAFALLAVDRVETRCLEGFKMIDGFQSYAKP